MPSQATMLLVGEQEETGKTISEGFPEEEVLVRRVATGREALKVAAEMRPSVIVVGSIVPDMPAADLVMHIREWSTAPIIVVSNDSSVETITELLNAGADDYVTMPLNPKEFKARIEVAFRHRRRDSFDFGPIYRAGGTTVNLATRVVDRNGETIPLTPLEFQILAELIRGAGRIVTREDICRKIWSKCAITELQTLRVYVGTLRNKLGRCPDGDVVIETISGVGYRLFQNWTSGP